MKLIVLVYLVPAAAAFGHFPSAAETTLYLNEGVGWCESDFDQTPCSFDCEASYDMEDYDIAMMCYNACVSDFPDETIENVEYYQGGCYCQTSCPSMECDSNTATVSEEYHLPACSNNDDNDDNDDDYDFSCVSTCGINDDWSNWPGAVCENLSCATTCDETFFATYDQLANYCLYGDGDDQSCGCDDRRRRLDMSPAVKTRKTQRNVKRAIKGMTRAIQKAHRK